MSKAVSSPVAGVLNIDKAAGWTSHDVVARVRRLAGQRQVGHAGTLDPLATGVLVVGLGAGTRLLEYATGQPKTYRAVITLGQTTTTYDAEGEVTTTSAVPPLSLDQVNAALDAFRGSIWQRPPAFSALKRDGVALYKLARAGEEVEVEPRPVTIYDLTLLALDGPRLELIVHCGAGVYIRSLAHDLGQALGCGAHLAALRRTAVGQFTVDRAVTLDQLADAAQAGALAAHLLPVDALVAHLPRLETTQAEAERLLHGQTLAFGAASSDGELARAYNAQGEFVGIVRADVERRLWRPHKVLAGVA